MSFSSSRDCSWTLPSVSTPPPTHLHPIHLCRKYLPYFSSHVLSSLPTANLLPRPFTIGCSYLLSRYRGHCGRIVDFRGPPPPPADPAAYASSAVQPSSSSPTADWRRFIFCATLTFYQIRFIYNDYIIKSRKL